MPAPASMQTTPNNGFTMMEALVAIALCGLMAIFLVPKLMHSSGEEQTAAIIQDTYTTIGELFLARESDSKATAVSIGSGNEDDAFAQYIIDHLRLKPAAGSFGTNYCNTSDYFTLQSGAIIRRICDQAISGTDTLQVTIRVPRGNTNTDFMMVIPEDPDNPTTGASAGRYTTLFGFKKDKGLTINAGDCGTADKVLKVTSTCL